MIWPNEESAANSDPWLIANHDEIRLMRPRVLAVNFVTGLGEADARAKLESLCAALRESSRWQGHRDPAAPAFLDYELVDVVDLTEPRGTRDRNSARFPRAADGIGFDYAALHELRLHDGLRLQELAERGLVNEVWLLADHTDHSAPWETVEVKRAYDEALDPVGVKYDAGNSGEHHAPWIGRSLRILFVNFARGVGCAMESLGHSLERMATCGALPYYERYFREYAMLDLDRRYGLPFESLYLKGPANVSYPSPTTLQYRAGWRKHRVEDYVPTGGNVHFMPNGRFDYDLDGDRPGALDDRDLAPAGARGATVDPGGARAVPRARARLHGPLGRLLAPEHARARQHRARRRRPPDEELVAVSLLLAATGEVPADREADDHREQAAGKEAHARQFTRSAFQSARSRRPRGARRRPRAGR